MKNEDMMKKYYDKYNKISFFLACMIVYRHSLNYTEYTNIDSSVVYWIEKFFYCASGFATMLFALLAGFNLFMVNDDREILAKVKKRFYSLVVPYIIAITVNWLLFALLPYIPVIKHYINKGLYPFTFMSYIHTVFSGGGLPLWYLRNLIIMVFLSPFIYKIMFNKISSYVMITCLMLVWMIHPQDQFSVLYFACVFLIGACFGKFYRIIMLNRTKVSYAIVGKIILLVLLVTDCMLNYSDNERIRLPYTIICALLFWMSYEFNKIEKHRFIKYSFGIYMYHYYINECINKVLFVVLGDSQLGALLNFALSPLICIIILILLFSLCEKIAPKALKIVLGGRN